jgi:hypothetical protein
MAVSLWFTLLFATAEEDLRGELPSQQEFVGLDNDLLDVEEKFILFKREFKKTYPTEEVKQEIVKEHK